MGETMQDKTGLYILVIVGIVALVGVVIMVSGPTTSESSSNSLTGNVVAYSAPVSYAGFGQVLFVLVVGGFAAYLYMQKHE